MIQNYASSPNTSMTHLAVIHHIPFNPHEGERYAVVGAALNNELIGVGLIEDLEELHLQVLNLFEELYHRVCGEEVLVYISDSTVRKMLMDAQASFPNTGFCTIIRGNHQQVWQLCQTAIWDHAQEYLQLYAEQNDAQLPLVVATDASKGYRSSVGLGYATSRGEVRGLAAEHDNIGAAELHAARWAIAAVPAECSELTVLCDSREVVRVGSGRSKRVYPFQSEASLLRQEIELFQRRTNGGQVLFRWVRGHSGDPLNEAAHRAAMAARRCYEFKLSQEIANGFYGTITQDLKEALATQGG